MKKKIKNIQEFHNQVWKTFLEQQQKGSFPPMWEALNNPCHPHIKEESSSEEKSWGDIQKKYLTGLESIFTQTMENIFKKGDAPLPDPPRLIGAFKMLSGKPTPCFFI